MRLRNQLLGGTAIIALLFGGSDAANASIQSLSGGNASSTSPRLFAQAKVVSNKATVAKITDITNLRKGPGTHYEIVARAVAGDSYPIVGSEGDWYQIKLSSGNKAYVANWVVDTAAASNSGTSSNAG
ncbi:uncharacterized protein YgiM (DUF1202 family) [Paenibacillus endophyticus]|uniref:Uncharacterized protein YgiM (DUF1202 family) n=1 Tax=Paenibacillus endophyticus TaxID=1294268 RepID=A0A7W5C4F3_9BACL|nr:SH3 domain-containing protein [Paenibacillus endophyticus]MBB3150570.1 uncharacterized protein YgiM (DUF1202 family) [Paenibacillus endophyticus]